MSIERAELRETLASAATTPVMAPASRSLIRQAYHDTLATTSARIGLAWLFLLAFFAVFAPFLANSHPFLMKMNGTWSSPALRHLAPPDVLLLIATGAAAVVGLWRKFSFLRSLGLIVAVVVVAAAPVYLLVRPPVNVDYSKYREALKSGGIQRAIFAPVPYSPRDRLRDQPNARLSAPNRAHWLGTDTNGADVFSLLLHASRIALSIGFIATSISVVIGILVGAVMGYYVGNVDLIGMRAIEIFEAIPQLFLLISITAFIQDRNIYVMMAVIGATSWTGYSRFLRAEFFTIRKLDYVQAAIAAGLPQRVILFRHMLANALTPILVSTTFGVASAILYESILSFLGIGLVDEASWGAMLQQARAGGAGFVLWIAIPPGAAIFLTVFAYNLVGEAIRDALDPKLRKRD
ncbi:MAG TPA: ABC transporter permease [Tepidisphaeraceae bacterium]|jgi:peptide/nickel transport system permease protein|nr:ABC transporter permease [Tepidisphaeraceae bacterium]